MGEKKACTLNIFIWKYPLCLYCVLCWHPVWLKVWNVVLEEKEKNYMMTNISYYNKWPPPCIGQWQGYFDYMTIIMPRAHKIHVMYNFEHHSSQVAAEWGVCVVIPDVRHTVKGICFSTSVQKLLTLLFSPFTQTWLTIWPSKKYKSHTNINF